LNEGWLCRTIAILGVAAQRVSQADIKAILFTPIDFVGRSPKASKHPALLGCFEWLISSCLPHHMGKKFHKSFMKPQLLGGLLLSAIV
jgi:hypothetical protein